MAATEQQRSEGLRIAHEGALIIAVWDGPPLPGQIDRLTSYARMRSDAVGPCGLLNVVVAGMPRFADSVRDEGARSFVSATASVGTAHVVLLEGFAGSAVRAFISTMRLASRSSDPTGTFRTLDEGARWLAPRMPRHERWTPEAIVAAYHRVAG